MKIKKLIYVLAAIVVMGAVISRVIQISNENAKEVFNTARIADIDGVPVETMIAKTKKGILREPVAVRNNKIFVSKSRVHKFKSGQKLSNGGRIVSVSKNIDMDTGLFIIKTSGTSGNHFIELEYNGVFVPLSAISNYSIMVSENEIATMKQVTVVASDAEHAVVKGLSENDIIILNRVEPATKIKSVNKE